MTENASCAVKRILKTAAMALVIPGLLVTVPVLAQQGAEELSVSVTALKGPLHLMQGRGGNVLASIGEDGILIIDDDYPQYAPYYEQALSALTGEGAVPRFLLNTHWHGDHTGGNAFWGERGAVIVAHENVLQRMSVRQEMKALGRVVEPSPKSALPVVTFDDGLALHFNGDVVEVLHYPSGHTDGDSVVFFGGENVVHMGDHFFNGNFPFVDIGSGGSVAGYAANVQAILNRIDDHTLVVPGHGPLANKADLARFHRMIESTSALVAAKLGQGLSVETIIEQGLGEQWQSWGQGFINEAAWISVIAAK